MIRITDSIALPDRAVTQRFVRAAGGGGQNVNRDATAVELRLDIPKSSLPLDMRERLIRFAGRHVTDAGVLMVVSRASNSQEKNRETAHARLLALLRRAARQPNVRRATRTPPVSREDRLVAKHQRSAVKRRRHATSEV